MRLTEEHRNWLSDAFGSQVRFDEPMARHTSLRVGGPADAYVAPDKPQDLIALYNWIRQNDLPSFTIGNGTNLLVVDNGLRGIVVSMKHCHNDIRHEVVEPGVVRITVGAAVHLSALCKYAIANGFKGMNFALGIPGTVGGAIVMNAGTAGGCMGDVVTGLKVFSPDGRIEKYDQKKLTFRYRGMNLIHADSTPATGSAVIILEGGLRLSRADTAELQAEADAILKTRSGSQPLHQWSAGSFFKNPTTGPTAGELIDRAGLKGTRVGDAQISNRHANFIVNKGNATAADIVELKNLIQTTVSRRFKVALEPEVQIVGT